jgi:tetratricopeptide (TPR) repeat protein
MYGTPPLSLGYTMYYCPWTSKATGIVGLFLLASMVYVGGLCPTIYWFDSPEFVTTTYTLDISHPAGSPTYSLLAKLATFLPLGSVAFRVNAFSALVGALAVTALFSLLYRLLVASSFWTRWTAALGGALFLLVSESFTRFAEVAEVYSLQNYFLILLCSVLLKARISSQPVKRRYYWLFAFLYGLSAGVHATMVLFAPAFFVFICLTAPRMFRGRDLAFLAFFFLLGFATYLYLPIRSLTEPAFNWGEPRTFQQFLVHISDRKDAAVHTILRGQQLPYQLSMYMVHLSNEFSMLGCLLGLIGFVTLWHRDKSLWLMLMLAVLGHTAFFIRTWWDTAWGFIPSFVIFAILISFGIYACLNILVTLYKHHSIHFPRNAVYTVLFGSIIIALIQNLTYHDAITNQATNYSTELYGKQLLDQLPPDSILFCEYSWFPLLYLQQVERQRPDLTFLLQGEVLVPNYYALISRKRFPNIQHITSEIPTTISTADYFWRLSRINAADHPLFWDPDGQYQKDFSEHLLPQGLLFAFHPNDTVTVTSDILSTHWKLLSHSTNRILQGKLEDSTTFFLSNKLNQVAIHFRHRGSIPEAIKTYQAALSMRDEDKLARNNYGALLLSQKAFSQALEQFNIVYDQDPINPTLNRNIGVAMLSLGDYAQAVHFFERALSFGTTEGEVYAQLGEAYAKLGHFSPALHALRSALERFTRRSARNPDNRSLQEQITWAQEWIKHIEQQLQANNSPG